MIIQLKLKTPSFYNKTLLRHPVILRSLVATYRVIIDQNPSGILKSEPIGPGKWVVENFDSISSGLLGTFLDPCFTKKYTKDIVLKYTLRA